MSYALSRYFTLLLRHAARVKDPHFALARHRVSRSSVVRASEQISEGRGFKSFGARIFPSSQWVPSAIDHFRITFGLFFKASLGAHPFI